MSRSLSVLAGAIALSAAWSQPAGAEEPTLAEAHYDPSEYPPSGTQSRLILTGAGLTVGWYAAAIGTSFMWRDAPNASDLRIPVAGPWLALADTGCGSGERDCETAVVVFRTAVTLISGVGQLGGLLVLAEGLFIGKGAPAGPPARPAASARDRRDWAGIDWSPTPVALPDGSLGIGISGRF
ncbi:MAG: hypothetical protein ABW217_13560 [Polyangiaceae bacterium]